MLQWGHGGEVVEDEATLARVCTTPFRAGFTPATAVRPWKTSGSRTERRAGVKRSGFIWPRR